MKKDQDVNVIDQTETIFYLNPQSKSQIIKHQSNGIITELNYYQGMQTILKKKIILQSKLMNINVQLDIMTEISNLINNNETNLKMCFIDSQEQQSDQQMLFQLIYAITICYGHQIREKEIDEAIVEISNQINLICQDTYVKGDFNLKQKIVQLFERYSELLA
ncbi:unnamed protein product [Paramecium sonneborni]|uniref:Uncharacterized protein n=1 Tax=Paramecium sonneborni TaxID=65129 RepID=A0A8S1JSX0_9CILI|nr:unnamed protein product [Paramecium sonneborni]